MLSFRRTAAVAFVLPLAAATATLGWADTANGPITHDYSDTGPAYHSSNSDESASQSKQSPSSDNQSSESKQSQASSDNKAGGKPYSVDCDGDGNCKVSKAVMTGYEVFGSHCLRCHGENAVGTSFGPSLVRRLKGMGQGKFTAAVAGGVTRMDPTTHMYKVMPAWSGNQKVMSNLQQLWAYLKARSDGALPPVRPVVKGNSG